MAYPLWPSLPASAITGFDRLVFRGNLALNHEAGIQQLPHTHRYQVTDHGRLTLNAVLSAQRTTTQQLTTLAA